MNTESNIYKYRSIDHIYNQVSTFSLQKNKISSTPIDPFLEVTGTLWTV